MDRAERVRQILSTRSLTLYKVSRHSGEVFGRSSPLYIPHNLFWDLAKPRFQPTISRVLALSHITNYRLTDWLAVFGFDLDAIFRLNLLIPRKDTTVLHSEVYDPYAWIRWFAERPDAPTASEIAPLGQFLTPSAPKRARDVLALNQRHFLYARIGERDQHAFSYFVPGSIVRVDTQRTGKQHAGLHVNQESPFFLVQHDAGFACSKLTWLEKDRVILRCPERPYAGREACIGKDVQVLGTIDAEIRPVSVNHYLRRITMRLARSPKPQLKQAVNLETDLRGLLRRSRMSLGMTFREASSLSRIIATILSDELYFVAFSTLSDYEASAAPPRHIQKIFTLCLLYHIRFEQFLRASGLPIERAGREPIPDELIPREMPRQDRRTQVNGPGDSPNTGGFLATLLNQWQEVPLFLRFSLDDIAGLKGFSLSDVFWVGCDRAAQHPLLLGATFIVVNRRSRNPPASGLVGCEQPLYLVLRRDGTFMCGRCTLEDRYLIVHGYPGLRVGREQYIKDTDVEIVGQITTIVRHL